MTRWDWTWEEAKPSSTQDSGPHLELPGWLDRPDPARQQRFRRRRAAAGLAAVALLALIVAMVSGGGSAHRLASTPVRHATPPTPTAAELQAAAAVSEQRAIDTTLAQTPVVVSGGTAAPEVALTFDDGPGPFTERIVAALRSLHAPATFFAVGRLERYFAAGTLAELRAGYPIGDHTQDHLPLATLSAREQRNEMVSQVQQLGLLGVPYPRLFRPPYGSFNATTFRVLRGLRMLMILWSTETADFRLPGVQAIVDRALAGAHPGAIILMHDGGGDRSQTLAALPAIVHGLRARGLRPVTIPRLLRDDPPPPGQPIPTSLSGG